MADSDALATFLRSRRDLLKPVDVGLAEGEGRRVAGLRREEVAMLAGISAEYYQRLEQGRERRPSDQVLESLAVALQLNDDATQYMRNLTRSAPRRRRRASAEKAAAGLQTLIDTLELTAAYVQNRHTTVLAANPMARVLMPHFAPPFNHLRSVFMDPEVRAQVRNWDEVTAVLVSWLRFNIADESPADPELQSLPHGHGPNIGLHSPRGQEYQRIAGRGCRHDPSGDCAGGRRGDAGSGVRGEGLSLHRTRRLCDRRSARTRQHLLALGVSKELLPERLIVVDEVPRSSGGKVAKGELRQDTRARMETEHEQT
jgi:transcriptional regulator with XRE-family HTH domain